MVDGTPPSQTSGEEILSRSTNATFTVTFTTPDWVFSFQNTFPDTT